VDTRGKEMTFTKEDRCDKIRSQLKYELFGASNTKHDPKVRDKSTVGLHKQVSKKAKFLQRIKEQEKRDPGVI
jgi:hypothetical protein